MELRETNLKPIYHKSFHRNTRTADDESAVFFCRDAIYRVSFIKENILK